MYKLVHYNDTIIVNVTVTVEEDCHNVAVIRKLERRILNYNRVLNVSEQQLQPIFKTSTSTFYLFILVNKDVHIWIEFSKVSCCFVSDQDDCLFNPCRNNGTCVDLASDFSCICPTGWKGKSCNLRKITLASFIYLFILSVMRYWIKTRPSTRCRSTVLRLKVNNLKVVANNKPNITRLSTYN